MSNGLNKVLLIGNLAADSELKVTQGGTSVLKFRLACSETYTDKSGAKQTKTEWVSCVLWGKVGESLHRYMLKGKQELREARQLAANTIPPRNLLKLEKAGLMVVPSAWREQ